MPHSHRLFFALPVPETPQRQVVAHRNTLSDLRSPVRNDRLHCTLAITDDFAERPAALEDILTEIGHALSGEPVAILLEELSANTGSVALRPRRVLPCLHDLHARLAEPMRRRRLLREGWTHRPHITLGYRQGAPYRQPIQPIEWVADEVVLIHSIVGATRHIVIGRWRLVPRQGDLFH